MSRLSGSTQSPLSPDNRDSTVINMHINADRIWFTLMSENAMLTNEGRSNGRNKQKKK